MLPLLHVAQGTAELSKVDGGIVASAGAAMASAIVAIWRPRSWRRFFRRRRTWSRGATIGVGLLVILAVLPSALPVDHLIFAHQESAGHQEVHTAHCHGSPSSCSDLPLVSGPGQFILNEPLIAIPSLFSLLLMILTPTLHGISLKPEVRPPLRLRAYI